MIEPHTFADILQALGHAFGKKLEPETIVEYYNALGKADLEDLQSAVQWAKANLDGGFPRIATLRQRIDTGGCGDGWPHGAPARPRIQPAMVFAVCPKCGCRFAVMRTQLAEDARRGTVYRCPNGRHWGCTVTLEATEILKKEGQ
jgi:hypothetical protein